MKKTLILCFIHGFRGDESTFGDGYLFTRHLRDAVAKELPKINVKVLVYPKYETRGDLTDCVSRFSDWLLEKVIDIEVEAGTSSPTVDPSVHTVLVGHSMGGIVAAETVIRLTSDKPIHHPSSTDGGGDQTEAPASPHTLTGLMFPYIQGVLAFDTPYLGISPGVLAHGAQEHYSTASAALNQFNNLFGTKASPASSSSGAAAARQPAGALPAPPSQAAQADNSWGKWGRIAMYAGAATAVAAGSAAAYMNRDQITQSVSFVSSHLEFVGCLARGEDLRRRVAYMVRAGEDIGLGFANLYTRLGEGAGPKKVGGVVGTVWGGQRTFCNLPRKMAAGVWKEAVNDRASDETVAHMNMFEPKRNSGYAALLRDATGFIVQWNKNEWYESSTEAAADIESGSAQS